MLPFIIGGVTLATISNALCEDSCDYFESNTKKQYEEFLAKYDVKDSDIDTDSKLEKQKFTNEEISEELKPYVAQISDTIAIVIPLKSTLKYLDSIRLT